MADTLNFYESENNEIREQLKEQRSYNIQSQIDREMEKITNNQVTHNFVVEEQNDEVYRKMTDLQLEVD